MSSDTNFRLRAQAKEEQQAAELQQNVQQQTGREFNSVEEALRCDAAQIEVPPAVAERLKDSLEDEPRRGHTWWRRLFSRGE